MKGQTLLHKKHFANTINTKEGARFLGLLSFVLFKERMFRRT